LTTLDQRRALALRIAKTIQRDPASIVASLRARLDTFKYDPGQDRDSHGRWTDEPGGGLGKLIKKAVSKFSPSDQEEYDKLEKKLGTTGHLRGKEAERHNALRKKIHGSPSPSYDTEDEGPTRGDNEARHRELLSRLEGDEGLSGEEMNELKSLDILSLDHMTKSDWAKLDTGDKARIYEALGDPSRSGDDEIEDLWRKVTEFDAPAESHFKPGMPSKHVDELERQEREALHPPKNKPFDAGLTKQEKADIAEYLRLERKLEESFLTDAENIRHNELRRKVEGQYDDFDED
jgi:hypothetical protein